MSPPKYSFYQLRIPIGHLIISQTSDETFGPYQMVISILSFQSVLYYIC